MSSNPNTETLICPDCTTEFSVTWETKDIISYCPFCGYEFDEEDLGESGDEDEEILDEET
jgi:endogenous inhibitor of DNA gyrase (YacG/DUF329 family)|tara:strand:+ start:10434 stop:10613 length:180 start_codon:yes stop_codon:yes gene_type:complete